MTLTVMTIVTVVMLPSGLGYTAWTDWVFRQRVSPEGFDPHTKNPIDLMRGSGPTEESGPTSASSG
jgi:hypothetical protein